MFSFPAIANVSRLRLLAKRMAMMISSHSMAISVRRGSVADRQRSRCRAAFGICWISRFCFAMSLLVSPSNVACLYINSDNPSTFLKRYTPSVRLLVCYYNFGEAPECTLPERCLRFSTIFLCTLP
jgi:hypothetical protein